MDRLDELMAQIDAEGRAEEEARAELQRQRRDRAEALRQSQVARARIDAPFEEPDLGDKRQSDRMFRAARVARQKKESSEDGR